MGKRSRKKAKGRLHKTKEIATTKHNRQKKSDDLKPTMEETDDIHLYFWFNNQDEEGHISMKLTKGIYISFRPTQTDHPIKVTEPVHPKRLADDVTQEMRDPDRLVKMAAGRLNEDGIISWWKGFKKKKSLWLLKHQNASVMYDVLRAGGGFVREPIHWTPKLLESYVECILKKKRPTQGYMDWYKDMDFQSKLYFFVIVGLLAAVLVLTLRRFTFTRNYIGQTHTCYNDYKPCKEYVKQRFGEPVPESDMTFADVQGYLSFTIVALVMLVGRRVDTSSLLRILTGQKPEELNEQLEDPEAGQFQECEDHDDCELVPGELPETIGDSDVADSETTDDTDIDGDDFNHGQ